MDIKRGIDKSTAAVVVQLKKDSKPISDSKEIKQVATISANNDEQIGYIPLSFAPLILFVTSVCRRL